MSTPFEVIAWVAVQAYLVGLISWQVGYVAIVALAIRVGFHRPNPGGRPPTWEPA